VSSGEPTRFALLAGGGRAELPRLQTLRTTIDWSYDLLTAGEQILLRRLCAFAGRFTLDDVESVCTSGDLPVTEVFAMGSSLFDKSLVWENGIQPVRHHFPSAMEATRGSATRRVI
jgi:predicted ATPase